MKSISFYIKLFVLTGIYNDIFLCIPARIHLEIIDAGYAEVRNADTCTMSQ